MCHCASSLVVDVRMSCWVAKDVSYSAAYLSFHLQAQEGTYPSKLDDPEGTASATHTAMQQATHITSNRNAHFPMCSLTSKTPSLVAAPNTVYTHVLVARRDGAVTKDSAEAERPKRYMNSSDPNSMYN